MNNKFMVEKEFVDAIVNGFPNFKEYEEYNLWDRENPYLFLGVFADYLSTIIKRKNPNDPDLLKAFEMFNEEFSRSNSVAVINMINSEIFEKLSASRAGNVYAKQNLKGKALESFNRIAEDVEPLEE